MSCLWAGRFGGLWVFPIESVPGVRSVEQPDSYIADHLWLEVPDIHAHPRVLPGVQRFPVCGASANTAAYCAQSPVTVNVLVGAFRVSMNPDGADIVVGPERAESSTNGAVAIGDFGWAAWNLNSNGTAVTGGFEHVLAPAVIAIKVSQRLQLPAL